MSVADNDDWSAHLDVDDIMDIDENVLIDEQQVQQIIFDQVGPSIRNLLDKIKKINEFQKIMMGATMTPEAIENINNNFTAENFSHQKYIKQNYLQTSNYVQGILNQVRILEEKYKLLKEDLSHNYEINKQSGNNMSNRITRNKFQIQKKVKSLEQKLTELNGNIDDITECIALTENKTMGSIKNNAKDIEKLKNQMEAIEEKQIEQHQKYIIIETNLNEMKREYEYIIRKIDENKEFKKAIVYAINNKKKISKIHPNDVIRLTISSDIDDERHIAAKGALFPYTDIKNKKLFANNCWRLIFEELQMHSMENNKYYLLKIRDDVELFRIKIGSNNWGWNVKEWKDSKIVKRYNELKANNNPEYNILTISCNTQTGEYREYKNMTPMFKKNMPIQIKWIFIYLDLPGQTSNEMGMFTENMIL